MLALGHRSVTTAAKLRLLWFAHCNTPILSGQALRKGCPAQKGRKQALLQGLASLRGAIIDADVGHIHQDGISTRAGLDRTAGLLVEGYPFLGERRHRWGAGPYAGGSAVELRLLGERAICVGGPEAARLFYDPERFRGPVAGRPSGGRVRRGGAGRGVAICGWAGLPLTPENARRRVCQIAAPHQAAGHLQRSAVQD